MADPPDEPAGSDIDPRKVIEEIRTDPRISPESRAVFEAAHNEFVRIENGYAPDKDASGDLWHAFGYGTIIGSYVAMRDPTVLTKIDELRGGIAGTKSGEARQDRPWHARATETARNLRRDNPGLSQERLAEKIREEWSAETPCPSVDTLKDFILKLERADKLPRRKILGG